MRSDRFKPVGGGISLQSRSGRGPRRSGIIEHEKFFDLILLDIMLPGIDGFDIMEYIRPMEIPVIFITAKYEVRDRVKGLKRERMIIW